MEKYSHLLHTRLIIHMLYVISVYKPGSCLIFDMMNVLCYGILLINKIIKKLIALFYFLLHFNFDFMKI